jgi:beta-lactam-binding protein with PASTA domain
MTFFNFIRSKEFLKQLLYAGLAIVVLVFVLLWWLRSTTNHNQKIEVPNLAKLSIDKVEGVLNELDLRYEVLDSANFNPEYPRFSIIEQIPGPGKYVKEDRKIYLTINPSGYRKVRVPEVLGITARQAKPTLLALGFQVGKLSKRPHISDHVLEMRYKGEILEPGAEIPKTSIVDLIVGDGSKSRVQREERKSSIESELEKNAGE